MKLLEERIRKDGKVLPGDVLKIDSFLNHQIDIELMDEIGKEFYRLFEDTAPTKILTIEASGIAIAYATARCFGSIPVIFAKKTDALNMDNNTFSCRAKSYTRDKFYEIKVAKEFLKREDRVLIIDDFLANGEAMNSLISICDDAGAKIVGCGSVVAKTYQSGEERIKAKGVHLEVLARVSHLEEGHIEFA